MRDKYLIINAGSSSLKFTLYNKNEEILMKGNFEKIGNEFHPDKVSDYMTEIKGKSFVFEDISDYVPQGIISFVDAQKAHYLRKSLK